MAPVSLRLEVIKLNHDHKLAGHLWITKTLKRIQDRYYWPHMIDDITAHINSCMICAKQNIKGSISKVPLQFLPTTTKILNMLNMDILGPITETSEDNKYLLVISDHAIRYVIACPIIWRIKLRKLANHFVLELLLRCDFVTDQGKQFIPNVYQEVCELFQIKQLRTTAYHPQTDGLVERFIKSVLDMLTSYVKA